MGKTQFAIQVGVSPASSGTFVEAQANPVEFERAMFDTREETESFAKRHGIVGDIVEVECSP